MHVRVCFALCSRSWPRSWPRVQRNPRIRVTRNPIRAQRITRGGLLLLHYWTEHACWTAAEPPVTSSVSFYCYSSRPPQYQSTCWTAAEPPVTSSVSFYCYSSRPPQYQSTCWTAAEPPVTPEVGLRSSTCLHQPSMGAEQHLPARIRVTRNRNSTCLLQE